MKKSIISTMVILLVTSTGIAAKNNIHLQQATGKTDLSAYDCAKKAEYALNKLSLSNVRSSINLADNKTVQNPNKNSPRSVRANDSERVYSIQCNLFGGDIVNFTIAGTNSDNMKKIWDAFYEQ